MEQPVELNAFQLLWRCALVGALISIATWVFASFMFQNFMVAVPIKHPSTRGDQPAHRVHDAREIQPYLYDCHNQAGERDDDLEQVSASDHSK